MKCMDRAAWPKPEDNPLINLLCGSSEWISNRELADALGLVNKKGNVSVSAHFPSLIDDLADDTRMLPTAVASWQTPREYRAFNKRALIMVAMRARTPSAAAFRDWMADRMAKEAKQ